MQNILKILGIAISLPASILASYFSSSFLAEKQIIPGWAATTIVVFTVLTVLGLMVRYAFKQ